ncbi:dual specificity protein kinase pyk3 [Anaeramoeba flamelloides]|uniref:Dual specificity protein kinase pyk3 n=1 Tax=Anaeramoeba flamelloides TaxID=1746091 RepID=A0AAV7YRZ1_9EUKA|nr:dual specificity protein kinase pyk3 [Anaeramoeba flamelloides]
MYFDNVIDPLFKGLPSSNLSDFTDDLTLEESVFSDLNLFTNNSNSVEALDEQTLPFVVKNETEQANESNTEALQNYLEEMFSNFNPFDQDFDNELTMDFEEEGENDFPELIRQASVEETQKIKTENTKTNTETETNTIKEENLSLEPIRKTTNKKNNNPKISKKRVEKLKNRRRSERQKKILQTKSNLVIVEDFSVQPSTCKKGSKFKNQKYGKLSKGSSRKREIGLKNKNKRSYTLVESGKEIFKLLTGQLWVCTGGSSQKNMTPFTNVFAERIGDILGASENEIKDFKSQLKYLLSNSRRTFTEYICEILIAMVSLSLNENKKKVPGVVNRFVKLLGKISRNQKRKLREYNKNQKSKTKTKQKTKTKKRRSQKNKQNQKFEKQFNLGLEILTKALNEKPSKNISNKQQDNQFQNLQKQSQSQLQSQSQNLKKQKFKLTVEDEDQEIFRKLSEIFDEIFTERVLMYWFEKRYANIVGYMFGLKERHRFFLESLKYLCKAKFIHTCLTLSQDLIKKDGFVIQYSKLIDLAYDGDVLNLYSNNRGRKLKLIKELIVKYGLNHGLFWDLVSSNYLSKINYNQNTIFDHFPYEHVIKNSLLNKLAKQDNQINQVKKRTLAFKEHKIDDHINTDWLLKYNDF